MMQELFKLQLSKSRPATAENILALKSKVYFNDDEVQEGDHIL